MTSHAQGILQAALSLDDDDRAELAAELLASLDDVGPDDEASTKAAGAAELERRATRALSGEDEVEDWDEVRDRVMNDLHG